MTVNGPKEIDGRYTLSHILHRDSPVWVSGIRKMQLDSTGRWSIREGYGQAGWKVRSVETAGEALPHQIESWEGGQDSEVAPVDITVSGPPPLRKTPSKFSSNRKVCGFFYIILQYFVIPLFNKHNQH